MSTCRPQLDRGAGLLCRPTYERPVLTRYYMSANYPLQTCDRRRPRGRVTGINRTTTLSLATHGPWGVLT